MHFIRRYVTHLLVAAVVAGCVEREPAADNPALASSVMGLRGRDLPKPLAKPAFTFARTDGTPYHFVQETEGKVALLFLGYTNCPDVCPLHMANIAAVLQKMPWEERNAIRVVFVTTDPERDTPERLHQWLAAFDPAFIGLRGPRAEVAELERSLGVAPAVRGRDSAGTYAVNHAAQVIAFGRDNVARVAYPFGTRQEDWAYDLPRLVRDSP